MFVPKASDTTAPSLHPTPPPLKKTKKLRHYTRLYDTIFCTISSENMLLLVATLMGRFPSLMGHFPTLMGPFPECLNETFFPLEVPLEQKQPFLKKRGIDRGS